MVYHYLNIYLQRLTKQGFFFKVPGDVLPLVFSVGNETLASSNDGLFIDGEKQPIRPFPHTA